MQTESVPSIASQYQAGYALPVAANSANGFDGPKYPRRTSAPSQTAGAFFVPVARVYGGCALETVRSAGFLGYRSVNQRTAATLNRLTAVCGSSTIQGAIPMTTPRNSSTHAAAWKARALAALRSNSSLSVRLRRYNEAMARARAIELGGAK